jgi:hypothetical protein
MMRDDVTRRLIWAVTIGVGWGLLSAFLGLGWGWWLAGLVVMDICVMVRARRARKPKQPKRVGPRAEWID